MNLKLYLCIVILSKIQWEKCSLQEFNENKLVQILKNIPLLSKFINSRN